MDKGHKNLISDIENLLDEAKNFQFHDFKNDKYPMPKHELVRKFEALSSKVKTGSYDN